MHARTLDVDSDEIYVGEHACQSHGVFSLATAQLQDNGGLVVEIFLAPFAFHLEGHVFDY